MKHLYLHYPQFITFYITATLHYKHLTLPFTNHLIWYTNLKHYKPCTILHQSSCTLHPPYITEHSTYIVLHQPFIILDQPCITFHFPNITLHPCALFTLLLISQTKHGTNLIPYSITTFYYILVFCFIFLPVLYLYL